jgi:hypothetical protein
MCPRRDRSTQGIPHHHLCRVRGPVWRHLRHHTTTPARPPLQREGSEGLLPPEEGEKAAKGSFHQRRGRRQRRAPSTRGGGGGGTARTSAGVRPRVAAVSPPSLRPPEGISALLLLRFCAASNITRRLSLSLGLWSRLRPPSLPSLLPPQPMDSAGEGPSGAVRIGRLTSTSKGDWGIEKLSMVRFWCVSSAVDSIQGPSLPSAPGVEARAGSADALGHVLLALLPYSDAKVANRNVRV